jgi:hypothetical protein
MFYERIRPVDEYLRKWDGLINIYAPGQNYNKSYNLKIIVVRQVALAIFSYLIIALKNLFISVKIIYDLLNLINLNNAI